MASLTRWRFNATNIMKWIWLYDLLWLYKSYSVDLFVKLVVSCVFSSFIDVPFQRNDDLASEFNFFLGVSMNSQQEIIKMIFLSEMAMQHQFQILWFLCRIITFAAYLFVFPSLPTFFTFSKFATPETAKNCFACLGSQLLNHRWNLN